MVDQTALVAVLKDKRDLQLLRTRKWYRIPLGFLPQKSFRTLAFYEPGRGKSPGRIRYLANISRRSIRFRHGILKEPHHPRSNQKYCLFHCQRLIRLKRPVINTSGTRVVFAFVSRERLVNAKNLLDLLGVAPLENIMLKALKNRKVDFTPQFSVPNKHGRRYRLDFAVFCQKGSIAIECDGNAAHSSFRQRLRDRKRDYALKRLGWKILRFRQNDILQNLDGCVIQLQSQIRHLGGQ